MNTTDRVPPDPPASGPPTSGPPAPGPSTLRRAVTYGVVIMSLAVAALCVASLSVDGIRTVLLLAAPAIVGLGGFGALWQTYTEWRHGGRWQVWQGVSWFLLAAFLFFLANTTPMLVS